MKSEEKGEGASERCPPPFLLAMPIEVKTLKIPDLILVLKMYRNNHQRRRLQQTECGHTNLFQNIIKKIIIINYKIKITYNEYSKRKVGIIWSIKPGNELKMQNS